MELPLPGVEDCGFDSGIIWKTVTDTTRRTYSDDYTFEQLHTAPTDQLEATVNDLLAQQAATILGHPGPTTTPQEATPGRH